MIITSIKSQKRNPNRVNVHIDGSFRLALGADVLLEAGLHVGDAVSTAELEGLERQDLAWKARDTALNLLSFRARSASELRLRLRRKEFPAEVVDSCVTSLIEKGLVDDSSFAESFVRDRVRLRPRGPTRLMQELREKGVDGETAEAAVAEIMDGEGVSEVDLARAAAASWRRRSGEDRRKAGNRLYGFLGRRGFSRDAIRIVMEEVMNES